MRRILTEIAGAVILVAVLGSVAAVGWTRPHPYTPPNDRIDISRVVIDQIADEADNAGIILTKPTKVTMFRILPDGDKALLRTVIYGTHPYDSNLEVLTLDWVLAYGWHIDHACSPSDPRGCWPDGVKPKYR